MQEKKTASTVWEVDEGPSKNPWVRGRQAQLPYANRGSGLLPQGYKWDNFSLSLWVQRQLDLDSNETYVKYMNPVLFLIKVTVKMQSNWLFMKPQSWDDLEIKKQESIDRTYVKSTFLQVSFWRHGHKLSLTNSNISEHILLNRGSKLSVCFERKAQLGRVSRPLAFTTEAALCRSHHAPLLSHASLLWTRH